MAGKKKSSVSGGGPETPQRCLPVSQPAGVDDISELARRYGPACVDFLAQVAAEGSDANRVAAAKALLDRGFGKVGQTALPAGPDKTMAPAPLIDLSGLSAEAIVTLAKTIFGKEE